MGFEVGPAGPRDGAVAGPGYDSDEFLLAALLRDASEVRSGRSGIGGFAELQC